MKKYIGIIIAFFSVLTLFACSKPEIADVSENSREINESQNTVCAYVDGESVTKNEVDYFSERLRGKIITDYTAKYGITDFSDFWNTEYEGYLPSEELEKEALNAAVRAI